MTTDETTMDETGAQDCGLLLNPLKPIMDPFAQRMLSEGLAAHAMADRLLTAARRSAATGDSKPIWLERRADVPDDYHLTSLVELTRQATRPEDSGVLLAYIPMSFMRAGRVRAALSTLSERLVGGPGFPLVLGTYVADVLRDPIEMLPEWGELPADEVAAFLERLDADPATAVEEIYGSHSVDRDGAENLDILMRISGARQGLLAGDPDPRDEATEADEDTESLADAYQVAHIDPVEAPVSPTDAEAAPDAEEVAAAAARQLALDVATYVEAATRAELSPVIARCLTSYRTRGYAAATEELKVTKAPRKTLGALAKFARHGWPAVIVMFDQFTGWEDVPDDLRLSIASALTEMRWAMAGSAVVVVSSSEGETPEIEEQFGSATKIVWDSAGLPTSGWQVENKPEELPLDLYFEAATLCEPAPKADDPVIALAMGRADGDLAEFVRLAGFAIDEAMAAGSATLDPASLDRAPEPEAEAADESETGEPEVATDELDASPEEAL